MSVCIQSSQLSGQGTHLLRSPLPLDGYATSAWSTAGGEAGGSRLTLLALGGILSAEIDKVNGFGDFSRGKVLDHEEG